MIEVKQGPYSLSMDKVKFKNIDEKKLKLSNNKFIPVSKPHVSKQDIKSINKVIKSGWISSDGPEVKIFEKFSKN